MTLTKDTHSENRNNTNDINNSNNTNINTNGDNNNNNNNAYSAVKATYNVILHHWPEIILVMFVAAYWSAGYYACFIWMAYYTSNLMPGGGLEHHPWIVNITMLIVLVVLLPFGGIVGDIMTQTWK